MQKAVTSHWKRAELRKILSTQHFVKFFLRYNIAIIIEYGGFGTLKFSINVQDVSFAAQEK